MAVERRVRIVNDTGLHARPCHAIASLALGFHSELRVACSGVEVNGRSILELMTLQASQGQELVLRAVGEDAQALADALEGLIASGFAESP